MDIITTILVFVAGLLLGSLLNIVIVRLPREGKMSGWPRCVRCGRELTLLQLVPVIGWIAQGGKGRCCGRQLNPIFPIVELVVAVVLTLFYVRYGFTSTFYYLTFVTVFLTVTGAIDWLHRSIYTAFVLLPALVALIVASSIPGLGFLNALIGALVAGFAFTLMFILARFLFPAKAAPFGLGDVYLGIFIGAAVGLTNLMIALFYGMLLAGLFSAVLVILKRLGRPNIPEYISYGTFLCVGTVAYLVAIGLQSS
jgi:leader peptidase (prepilin peptidase)/N-methyltransferase